jgi:hypothetical protein
VGCFRSDSILQTKHSILAEMRVILLIKVDDAQLHVAGWLATTAKATKVPVIQRDKKI